MTIGKAIQLEREAKGWSQQELADRMDVPAGEVRFLESVGRETAIVIDVALDLRRAGLDPIARMLRAEAEAAEPWRADPVRAAELVTGERWEVSGGVHTLWTDIALLADVYDTEDDVDLGHGWDVYDGRDILAFGTAVGEEGKVAASVALLQHLQAGTITLPQECPGLAALEGVEW